MSTKAGHIATVANFTELIAYCNGYGDRYNPGNPDITPERLTEALERGKTSVRLFQESNTRWMMALNDRQAAFKPMRTLTTRIFNSLSASRVTPQVIENARPMVRKLHGRRAVPLVQTVPPDIPPAPPDASVSAQAAGETAGQAEARTNRISQLSFDRIIFNFEGLVHLVASTPGYSPNEADLTVAALEATLAELKRSNKAVIDAYTDLSNARLNRDKALYDANTGIITLGKCVKVYVKSVFNTQSKEFRQISRLRFRATAQ